MFRDVSDKTASYTAHSCSFYSYGVGQLTIKRRRKEGEMKYTGGVREIVGKGRKGEDIYK